MLTRVHLKPWFYGENFTHFFPDPEVRASTQAGSLKRRRNEERTLPGGKQHGLMTKMITFRAYFDDYILFPGK